MAFPTISPPVLSWDVIIGILSEEDYLSDQEDTKTESAYVHIVSFIWENTLEQGVHFVVGTESQPSHPRP